MTGQRAFPPAAIIALPQGNSVFGDANGRGVALPALTAAQINALIDDIDLSTKADLVSGKVPASQLPSYVDDVLEFANLAAFPASGEAGKLYVDTTANFSYRWTGSVYVRVDAGVSLGETSSTAYRGDLGKIAYDHSQFIHNKDFVGLNNIDNTSDANKPVSTAQATALSLKAASSHTHGNISNAGAIGSTASLPLITEASGVIATATVASFRTTLGLGTADSPTFANVNSSGSGGFAGNVTSNSSLIVGSGVGSTRIWPDNSNSAWIDSFAVGSFNRLGLGPLTASYPAFKRNGTAVNFRLGDDSADANITAAAATLSGAFNLAPITKAALLALTPTAATGGRWRVIDSIPQQREAYPDGTVWRYKDNSKNVALDDEVTYTPGGTTQTIPLNDGPTQTLLLSSATGTVTATLTIPSQPSSGRIIVRQGATPRLVTLAVSSGTLVLLGAALPLDAANTMRVYSWTYDGTRTIVGPSEVSV